MITEPLSPLFGMLIHHPADEHTQAMPRPAWLPLSRPDAAKTQHDRRQQQLQGTWPKRKTGLAPLLSFTGARTRTDHHSSSQTPCYDVFFHPTMCAGFWFTFGSSYALLRLRHGRVSKGKLAQRARALQASPTDQRRQRRRGLNRAATRARCGGARASVGAHVRRLL